MVSLARHTSGTDLSENFRRAVYIDTKFSYDNNVYFSIFCEQLKHGIHVIDPSRKVSSHCMTVQVVTSGYKWLQVVTSGYKWLQVVLCG